MIDPGRAFAVTPAGSWDGPVVAAIKAMAEGKARPDQQVRVLNFLLQDLCRTYDLSFRPDDMGGDRETAFAEGRRFVGLQLRRVLDTPFVQLVGREDANENPL